MRTRLLLSVLATILAATTSAEPTTNPAAWPAITQTAKPWTYWWWLGSAVNPGDITRELERFHAAGVGGVHIIPIYGAKGYENQFIDYLSPKWMEMLRHTVTEAHRLDMGVDMTTGTGWCFGGPTVSADDAVATLNSKVIEVKAGDRWQYKFPVKPQAVMAQWPGGAQMILTDDVRPDGSIDWTAPGENGAGDKTWKVYAIWQQVTKSGNKVKRSAPGGGGYMLNPFYADAVSRYLQWFDKPFADYTGPKPRSMYHDSYEYQVNWSPDLLEEFKKRRGYRLEFHLPEFLSDADTDTTARLKHDYRETVSDLMVDGLAKRWVDWSHAHGFITRYQAHGSPANLLDLYGSADIPETEMFHTDADPLIAKFASSAAHVMGRPLVSSETGTWMDEHFNETLAEYKHLVDLMFVSGVNHVFYHGACYSPDDIPYPGWHFYAATEMNPRNAFWHDVPAFNAYVARCQAALQCGHPDNDVLLYWPIHDLWSKPKGMVQNLVVHKTDWLYGEEVGKAARALTERGYGFDYVSDRQLATAMIGKTDVRAGIQLPGGTYRAIVVPAVKHMPVESLTKLLDLAKDGAQIVFASLPEDVPGLADLDDRRAAFRRQLARLERHPPENEVEQAGISGSRFRDVYIGELSAAAIWICPIGRESDWADIPGLRYVRRVTDKGTCYFLTNMGDKPIAEFVASISMLTPVHFMDPMTGRDGWVATRPRARGAGRQFPLILWPGESLFVTFPDKLPPDDAPRWVFAIPQADPIPLSGPWQIKFLSGGPELPKPFEAAKLESWTKNGDPEAERFAGTASYTITFDAPAGKNGPWRLDLGKVCESARVRLNGQDLGTVFALPFAVTIDALKPTGNVLEVEVTNLSANRIRDLDRRGVKWKTFYDANVVNIDYKPFDASKWPVRDSGLIGPVTLTPVSTEAPKEK